MAEEARMALRQCEGRGKYGKKWGQLNGRFFYLGRDKRKPELSSSLIVSPKFLKESRQSISMKWTPLLVNESDGSFSAVENVKDDGGVPY
mmetsp:Transcript_55546/g.118131  ORF Transcript_55546/g.118131 Transcript_55546/m.118131 type:complete len:90 (+) Transcript_55546:259-528(+)